MYIKRIVLLIKKMQCWKLKNLVRIRKVLIVDPGDPKITSFMFMILLTIKYYNDYGKI